MTSMEREGPTPDDSGLPDPETLGTATELVAALRAIKAVESLSLRELQRRSGLPRTTIAHALNEERPAPPPWERVLALLRAFGVAEGELPRWKDAWTRIRLDSVKRSDQGAAADPADGRGGERSGEPGARAAADPPEAEPRTAEEHTGAVAPVPGRGRPAHRRRRLLTHGATLVLGVLLGAGAVLGLIGAPGRAHGSGRPGPAEPCAPSAKGSDPAAVPPGGGTAARPVRARPAWVGRPAADAQILSGTDVVLPVTSPVTGGDALVVSVMLTSACSGPVRVTDTRGDEFRDAGEATDGHGHRTLLMVGFHVHPLTTSDSLRVGYPRASKYHVAVDEFRGISTVVGGAYAHGEAGGSAFSTGDGQVGCAPGDLLVAAVGTNSGTPAGHSAEWRTLPVLKLSSYRLSTAYRTAPDDRDCAVTGTTTAQWGAVVAAFR
ncbi:hypothetical protein ACFWXK_19560 [Streptomyces sp. NPDC059070]|uniref:hypothetical protein n=1 Tax=Streptomyces sp. NPDC059070 TaxID=3346713 RepID=UPI0036BBC6D4